jgi:hypothetical protein
MTQSLSLLDGKDRVISQVISTYTTTDENLKKNTRIKKYGPI